MGEEYIAVEFDGTLRHSETGKPIEAMVRRVKAWLSDGKDVIVFHPAQDMYTFNEEVFSPWCAANGLPELEIVCDLNAIGLDEIWSSKAVQLEPNTGRKLVPMKGYGGDARI